MPVRPPTRFHRSALQGPADTCLPAAATENQLQTHGPLAVLHVGGFDEEQIWQQMELRNEPLLHHLNDELEKHLHVGAGGQAGRGDKADDTGDGALVRSELRK